MNTQDYLALTQQRKQAKIEAGQFLELEMPSGAVWQYFPIKMEQYAVGGGLPLQLLTKLKSIKDQPAKTLTDDEAATLGIRAMIVVRDVMLNNLIFPKITLEPGADSITPEQIDPEDFEFFKNFVMFGAQSAAIAQKKT